MKKKQPAKKSTALARRPATKTIARSKVVQPTKLAKIAPAVLALAERVLTDDITIGQLGLVEVKYTEAEEAVMAESVPESEIRIKPTKEGTVYLSHPSYTRWFNRAFGRSGWALVPCSKPLLSENTVVQPYILHIHGQPVVYAQGECEYHSNNAQQTYGDALESTVASALRRCAKRLGISLELWDREWTEAWLRKFGILVKVKVVNKRDNTEKVVYQWRRKVDPPFWNEIGGGNANREQHLPADEQAPPRRRPQATAERPAANHPKADSPITTEMVTRFWTIARRAGRSDEDVKLFLKRDYNLDTSRAILRKDYENICMSAEHPGPLQKVIDIGREPGSDD